MLYKVLKFLFKNTIIDIYSDGYKDGYDECMNDFVARKKVEKENQNKVVSSFKRRGRTGRRTF